MSKQTTKSFLVKTEKVFGTSPVPPRFSQHRRACRQCGCTETSACMTESGACYWVEQDLCSACAPGRFSQHRDTTSIHAIIREKTDLAKLYAEDGAFNTAARVLEDLATVVSRHAVATTPRDLDDPMPCRVGDLMDSDYARDVMKIEPVAVGASRTGMDDPINLAGSGPVPIEAREG